MPYYVWYSFSFNMGNSYLLALYWFYHHLPHFPGFAKHIHSGYNPPPTPPILNFLHFFCTNFIASSLIWSIYRICSARSGFNNPFPYWNTSWNLLISSCLFHIYLKSMLYLSITLGILIWSLLYLGLEILTGLFLMKPMVFIWVNIESWPPMPKPNYIRQ